MDTVNAYERLQHLVDFLHKHPTREQLIVYLSESICPKGEIAGVSTAYLDDEGTIHMQFTHGFNLKSPPHFTMNIGDDNPGAEALRTMRINYVDLQTLYTSYTQALRMDWISDYSTAVAIPVTSRRIYGFTFISNIQEFHGFREYFECLRSILTFWESLNENRAMKRLPQPSLEQPELTPRQMKILEMVKEDRTNSAIASALGYSESLIRQETIIIYRKLGIGGRRELKRSVAS